MLLESAAPNALTAFAHGWSALLDRTLAPVLEDQALAEGRRRASGQPAQPAERPQAAASVAGRERPDRTRPDAVHGARRAEEPPTAPPAGGRRTRRGAEARHEAPPMMPATTPGTTKPPDEAIA